MGLDIGYNVYKRIGENKYKKVELDNKLFDSWMCGRTDLNYHWGDLFDRSGDMGDITFNENLENLTVHGDKGTAKDVISFEKPNVDNYEYPLTYVDFDEFVNHMETCIKDAEDEWRTARKTTEKRLADSKEELNHLLKLQMMADTVTAYNNAKQMVEDMKADIKEDEDTLNLDEDWDYWNIENMKKMLFSMKQIHSLGFVVIPFFSY